MSDADMARSHIERLLQDASGQRDLRLDADGHFHFRSGTAACWIGVDSGDPPVVTAVARAVVGVKRSMKLLQELNELNTRCRTSRVYWDNGQIMVEQSMLAHTVDHRSLAQAGQAVANVANDIGTMIATVFGGAVPVEEEA